MIAGVMKRLTKEPDVNGNGELGFFHSPEMGT